MRRAGCEVTPDWANGAVLLVPLLPAQAEASTDRPIPGSWSLSPGRLRYSLGCVSFVEVTSCGCWSCGKLKGKLGLLDPLLQDTTYLVACVLNGGAVRPSLFTRLDSLQKKPFVGMWEMVLVWVLNFWYAASAEELHPSTFRFPTICETMSRELRWEASF